jgi:hypothetical protein
MWKVRSRVSIRRLETPAGRGSGCEEVEGVASRDDMVECGLIGAGLLVLGPILEIVTGFLGLGWIVQV